MKSRLIDVLELEKKLKVVEFKLYYTRRLVVSLLPEDLKSILTNYDLGKDWYFWERNVIERVVSLATVSKDGMGYFSDRGYCPLCKWGNDHQEGFTLPIGLTRHLAGTHNATVCGVMEAATLIAKYHFEVEAERESTRA